MQVAWIRHYHLPRDCIIALSIYIAIHEYGLLELCYDYEKDSIPQFEDLCGNWETQHLRVLEQADKIRKDILSAEHLSYLGLVKLIPTSFGRILDILTSKRTMYNSMLGFFSELPIGTTITLSDTEPSIINGTAELEITKSEQKEWAIMSTIYKMFVIYDLFYIETTEFGNSLARICL